MSHVGEEIRRRRRELKWTQEELARRANISSVKMIESGARTGRLETLQAIAKALDTTVGSLLGETDETDVGAA